MKKEEMQKITDNWEIGKIISFKQAAKGVVNINWIIKTSVGKYVLRKVAWHRKLSELKFELTYLNYLKKHRFPYQIPFPLKTKDKKSLLKLGKSYFWIYKYIEGSHVKRFGSTQLKEVAKMMAGYHKIIENSKLDNKKGIGEAFNRNNVLKELKEFRLKTLKKPKKSKEESVFLRESAILIPIFSGLNAEEYSKLPRYPLHSDINPENVLWKGKKLAGVIDFETTGVINQTIIKDISVMLQYSCRKSIYKLDLNLAKFFLKEYKKYHPLSDKEIRFIPDVMTAGAVEDFSYMYWLFRNDPKRAKLYRMIKCSKNAQWCNKNRNGIIRKLIS